MNLKPTIAPITDVIARQLTSESPKSTINIDTVAFAYIIPKYGFSANYIY
jgi:hypothetical protein